MICFFNGDLYKSTRLAVQCGQNIQNCEQKYDADGVILTLHCAVASGEFFVFHVGGYNNEWKSIIFFCFIFYY